MADPRPRRFSLGDMVFVFLDGGEDAVVDWGPPNGQYLRQENRGPLYQVSSWTVLHVQVWHRYPRTARWYTGEHWDFRGSFYCGDWSEIGVLFERYFATGGLYERVAFCVEGFEWTWEDGWMTEDHV